MRLAALFLFAALGSASDRSVVLVVADDLGIHVGCYGDEVILTPHLDRLAAQSTRFDRAYATTASCSASRSVILTGLHNHANGQYGHQHTFHHFRTKEGVVSLPARMKAAGRRTARVGKFHVGPEEVYPFDTVLKASSRNPVQMAKACSEFLEDEAPFFLFYCTSDPHRGGGKVGGADRFGNRDGGHDGVEETLYEPDKVQVPSYLPNTEASRAEWAQYAQSVSRVDQGLGHLLESLEASGHAASTLVVFTSDHGVAFAGAKTTAYEPGLRVPLVVRAPGVEQVTATDAMVSHTDLAATLMAWVGADIEKTHGRSWLPCLEGGEGPAHLFASHTFHEVTMYYPMRVVRNERYKLIWNIASGLSYPHATDLWASSTWQEAWKQGEDTPYGPRTVGRYLHRPEFELYDLQADPWESTNLVNEAEMAEIYSQLKAELRRFQERTDDPWRAKWKHE